jgi:UDPglucose 6-dehydrogenase
MRTEPNFLNVFRKKLVRQPAEAEGVAPVNIGIFGTGYVGLVTAVCFADLGHSVVAVDKDADVIATLSAGQPALYEPGLEEMLTRNLAASRLAFTTRAEEAVGK